MVKRVDFILRNVLEKKSMSKEEQARINSELKPFIKNLECQIKNLKINAQVFVGGSFAKGTMIKKDSYDIDIFIRFDKRYKDKEFSNLLYKILKKMKEGNIKSIHGSRDYFRIKKSPDLFFEIVPVKKIRNPKEAENITDLSYSHVKYIKKKIKSQKVLDEIKIAKAFCYAKKCYGAESYIRGFSGYGLELLIYYYKSFIKMTRELEKVGKEKLIIDIEKFYKNKNLILIDINSSKLASPIILIDPTYKSRNVLAALSDETFRKFQKELRKFLKNPQEKDFEMKEIDFLALEKEAKKKRQEFVLLKVLTKRQEGDIAGSKMLKFYRYLGREIEEFFDVKRSEFEYLKGQTSRFCFVVKKKKEKIIEGPKIEDKKNVKRFRKKHKFCFTKNSRIYAKKKIDFTFRKFLENWKKKNSRQMKEMDIKDCRLTKFFS